MITWLIEELPLYWKRRRMLLMRLRLFVLGGRNEQHWCWNCAQYVHPNILQRIVRRLRRK